MTVVIPITDPTIGVEVDGDWTTLRVGDHTITVPTINVHLTDGRLFVQASLDAVMGLPADQVVVVANHPEPTVEQLQRALSGFDPDMITALMAQESSWSSMEDPIGLIAMRALLRAIAGESPEDPYQGGL